MLYRCFVEKRAGFDVEARSLFTDLRENLGLQSIDAVRVFNRYDVEGISEDVYLRAKTLVFSEPQIDDIFDETLPQITKEHFVIGAEALPGQYDQRADSCAQCIQMLTMQERPAVASAKIYVFFGAVSESGKDRLRAYLINPVDARECAEDKPATLARDYPPPPDVVALTGFTDLDAAALLAMREEHALAMDSDDLRFMQNYFRDIERRDPTMTELRLIDTYWSDHCRHTTFGTIFDRVEISDRRVKPAYELYKSLRREVYGDKAATRPETLMDLATIGAKALKKRGLLKNLDVSEEINACSIRIDVETDGKTEDWLLLFKNETHNHPTEIEPFGGAATCIGGAIRDPLSGRAFVYQAMRVTGAADPRAPMEATLPGKLPQRKLTVTAAKGYSSYGNQIGLATGLVHELYHPGYAAKRMEIGAVVGAVKYTDVRRETPSPGDVVILLGGRTGRDGIGGATGSSKAHNAQSLVNMASEVQKGNAPEERKLQRLFRDPEVSWMIKRCNDFGAGGVSVAIGELADGLDIDLSKVRKKYEGLGATELAISESQERMAVVVAATDSDVFIEKAAGENLEAYIVATVTAEPRMVLRHEGKVVANLSREFLSSNGAEKHVNVVVGGGGIDAPHAEQEKYNELWVASQTGLSEMFDSSVGAGTVLAPFGGGTQKTSPQVMAALVPVKAGETTTCSVMSFGFDPFLSEVNPYLGSKFAVIESLAKLVAAGCDPDRAYLTFQEYFERLRDEPKRWGKPVAALLGALEAQIGLETAAIGGKDSMSGSFNELDVPPTLVSFAIAPADARTVISPEFKAAEHDVVLFPAGETLPSMKETWRGIYRAIADGAIISAFAVESLNDVAAISKMCFGNNIGFRAASPDLPAMAPGAIIAEVTRPVDGAELIGRTVDEPVLDMRHEATKLSELLSHFEKVLEPVFPTRLPSAGGGASPSGHSPDAPRGFTGAADSPGGDEIPDVPTVSCETRAPAHSVKITVARPRALIVSFPGTNSEIDTAKAVTRAGGLPEIAVIKNLTPSLLLESVDYVKRAIENAQMLIIPGGFSGGDEPDGSAKFITAFFRNPAITDAIHGLLRERDGLMLGICNGFQALIKLGLVPYGEITKPDSESPTLTFNTIGRHQAKYVYTRIASLQSPWMSGMKLGDIHALPVSHGEGRFAANEGVIAKLIADGQLATQYCDNKGEPSMDIAVNPNGSAYAIEGIFSPDGRVFGKMGHSERRGPYVAKNITGDKHQPVFESGIQYFL